MARPFDESLPYQHMGSSLSSQTSLAGDRAWKTSTDGSYPSSLPYDVGQSMNPPRLTKNPSKKSQKPKLPKIKSSPSHGALAVARANHARFHRRGNSASQSPTSPTFVPDYLLQTASPVVPASAHANLYSAPESKERKSSKAKIKPLLRKFSSQEQVSIDLSRSAAENEGLGIYTSSEVSGALDQGPGRRGGYHNRNTSATSQLSSTTTSSNPRYGTQYVHPMRQTPRPYTPPIASSFKTSLESEAPTVNTSINTHSIEAPYFDSHSRSASHTAETPYAPLPSSRRPTALHIRTGSAARLTSSSQTNLPGTPSSLRFNTDTITPSDMMAPAGRSSLESAFRMRSRSNPAEVDPAVQKAIVDLKRQEFKEREAAKDLKYQQAEARAQEKEVRRRERKEEEERRTSEKRERKRARSNAASEKSSFLTVGEAHESFPSVQVLTQELPVATQPKGRKRGDTAESAGKAGKAVHSQWALFWFRFKTMWLRLKRKMSRSSN